MNVEISVLRKIIKEGRSDVVHALHFVVLGSYGDVAKTWFFNLVSFPTISVPVTAHGAHLLIKINDTYWEKCTVGTRLQNKQEFKVKSTVFFISKNIMNGNSKFQTQ